MSHLARSRTGTHANALVVQLSDTLLLGLASSLANFSGSSFCTTSLPSEDPTCFQDKNQLGTHDLDMCRQFSNTAMHMQFCMDNCGLKV